jgi:hypothetical protein
MPSLSARLWEEALRDEKELGKSYLAVVAALRTREEAWRGKALDWMREDLARRRRTLERKTPGAVEDVRQTLRQWQRDPQFDAVRSPPKLIDLPEKERREWWRFWSDVSALVRRADAMPAGRWRVEKGEIVQSEEATALGQVLYLGDAGMSYYTLEVEALPTGDEFGICVRAADPGTRLLVALDATKNRSHRLLLQREASPLRVLREVQRDVIRPKQWQHIRVTARGNRVRVVVNDCEVFDETIQDYERGRVGLWTMGPSARFRNVRVLDGSEKTLREGPPKEIAP